MSHSRSKLSTVAALILVPCLCLLSVVSLFSLVQAVPLTQHPGDITLRQGIIDELFVTDAWIIKDGETYKMWYTHSRSDMEINEMATTLTSILTGEMVDSLVGLDLEGLLAELAAIGDNASGEMDDLWDALLATTIIIGYAESTDGIDWDVQNDNVLEGNPSEWENVGMPCIIKDGSTYKMWLTHSETTLDKAGLQAILQDLDNADMGVVRDAIIALANSTSSGISYTTSADGQSWAAPAMVLGGGGASIWESIATPCVIEDNGTYKMWFTSAETSLNSGDIDAILADLANFDIDDLTNILDSTGSVISYTTSADGTSWAAPSAVMGSGGGVWNSVATPCVIKNSDTDYEMWYTNITTDLNATTLGELFDELLLLEPDMQILWDSLEIGDLDTFQADLILFLEGDPTAEPPIPAAFDAVKALLENTGTQIGYATSADGISWVEEDPAAISGYGGPWGSVTAPCVIIDGGIYKMWYTQGLEELTAQNIVSMLDGSILPIGYATSGEPIELVTGWNFVSLPSEPDSPNTEDVLADILLNVRTVWKYDAATGIWDYFTTIPGAPQGDLTQMEAGVGYWVEMTGADTLIVFGTEPLYPYDIELATGWNLVSIPKTPDSPNTEDVLADILLNVRTVWTYDASTGIWDYFTTIPGAPQGDLTQMTECRAYWIEMTGADTLTIN